jgi:hypothetical protein
MNLKTWREGPWDYKKAVEDYSGGIFLTKGKKYPTMVNDGNVYTVDDTGRLVVVHEGIFDDL